MYPAVNLELLNKYNNTPHTPIFINPDNSIDAKGTLLLMCYNDHMEYTDLPFKFGTIDRGFSVWGLQIKSLNNFPDHMNNLTIGCTLHLTSLDNTIQCIHGDFYCRDNDHIPYEEFFKLVDIVKGRMFINNSYTDMKDVIRRDKIFHSTLCHEQLGSLDV